MTKELKELEPEDITIVLIFSVVALVFILASAFLVVGFSWAIMTLVGAINATGGGWASFILLLWAASLIASFFFVKGS